MNLEGSLEAFGLPDVFTLLSMTGKTGALYLQRPATRGVVYLTGGGLTGGSADRDRQILARRVVGAGDVPDDALATAVSAVQSGEHPGVVAALRAAGAVSDSRLSELVSEHIVDTVFDLLRWPDGTFSFVPDDNNPEDVGVSVPPDDAVSAARARLEEWAAVADTVPSPATVLALAPAVPKDLEVSRDDWALLALLDGHRAVADVVALAGRGEFAVVSRLAELVERGLLRAAEGDSEVSAERRAQLLGQLESVPAAAAPAPREAGDGTTVLPARSEPFRPTRRPEHPDSLVGAIDGATARVPLPEGVAALLERDPAINRSTLLRLIAGVRGL